MLNFYISILIVYIIFFGAFIIGTSFELFMRGVGVNEKGPGIIFVLFLIILTYFVICSVRKYIESRKGLLITSVLLGVLVTLVVILIFGGELGEYIFAVILTPFVYYILFKLPCILKFESKWSLILTFFAGIVLYLLFAVSVVFTVSTFK